MNCKPGDVARVVQEGPAYGYIVTCVRRYDGPWREQPYCPGWVLDKAIPKTDGSFWPFAVDKNLRPIRYSDGQDEIMRLVGLPADSRQTA